MPKIDDIKSDEYEIKQIYEDYEKYWTQSIFVSKVFLTMYAIFLIIVILLFLVLIYLKNKHTIKDEVKTNKYQSIILYSFFGFILSIMINFNGNK